MINKNDNHRLGLPDLGLGVGLRSVHYPYILNHDVEVDWFEIISENYMDNFGYARHALEQIAAKMPIVMHGVSMSIGSYDPINWEYLEKLNELANFVQPVWISDHLCWTGIAHMNTHDLLPMPLTKESLNHVSERVLRVQDFLKRPLVLENPSTYLQFNVSEMEEWDFLSELVEKTDCGLLLDVNNVFVSSKNHGFDPEHYIQNIPHKNVVQIHLAGPTDCGDYLIDTHDQPVPSRVWELYQLAHQLTGGVSTLLEWDANIPEFPELVKEVQKAKQAISGIIPDTPVYKAQNDEVTSNPINFQLVESNGAS